MSIKVTTESFIQKAIEVHGDAYDYSEVEYTKAVVAVKVRCKKHDHLFLIRPNVHLSKKQGCPICKVERMNARFKKPNSYFIDEAIATHGNRFDYSLVNYVNGRTKVKIRCIKHDLVFEQRPNDHLRSKQVCPLCYKEHSSTIQRDTSEIFIEKSKLKYGGKFDYSFTDYVSAKVKVKLRCVKHDIVFETTPDSHLSKLSKGNCPECNRETQGQYHKLSLEDFIKRSLEKHNNFYDYSNTQSFKNMHEKVEVTCPDHGSFWQTPTNHLHNGFGCEKCAWVKIANERRLTQEEVISRFTSYHGDKFNYTEVVYDGVYSPVKIWCNTHNEWFYQKPVDHFSAVGCKKCVDKGFSVNKPAYFYINKVGNNVALKVGITNVCPIERAKVLDRKSSEYDIVNMFYFYHASGKFISDLESEILDRFDTGVVSKDKMSSGYTETIHIDKLPEIIDIVVYRFSNYKPD
jgi:hypothetical protein